MSKMSKYESLYQPNFREWYLVVLYLEWSTCLHRHPSGSSPQLPPPQIARDKSFIARNPSLDL